MIRTATHLNKTFLFRFIRILLLFKNLINQQKKMYRGIFEIQRVLNIFQILIVDCLSALTGEGGGVRDSENK